MGSRIVRNLDDAVIAALKRRAARHNRSAEAEHREILCTALAGEQRGRGVGATERPGRGSNGPTASSSRCPAASAR
jgi:plasmid stability protein